LSERIPDAGARGTTRHGWTSAGVLVAWACVGVGVAWREGEFSYVALPLVVLGWLVLAAVVLSRPALRAPNRSELTGVAFIVVATALFLRVERYMYAGDNIRPIQVAFALAALGAAATLVPRLARSATAEAVALGLAVAAGLVTIAFVDDAGIDVWYLLQQSSDGLLDGRNMYEQEWVGSNGLQDVYPYLPVTTVLLAPFRWAYGDVRYGLLVAAALSVVVARLLTAPRVGWRESPRYVPALLPLLIVVAPKWPFLIDQSWTEPLLVLLLAGALLALARNRPTLAVIALALALASKQHVALLLPLFALWPVFGWRRTVASGALAGVLVLPWWLASPQAFWADAVDANLSMGVLTRALCVPSWLIRQDVETSFLFLLVALGVAYGLVLWRVPRTLAGLALGSAFVMLTLDLANKQSFFNHYTLPLGLMVVALCAAAGEQGDGQRSGRRAEAAERS